METPQCGSSADIIRLATYFPTLSKQTSWQMVEYLGSSNLDYLSFFHVTDLHLEKALSPIHLAQKGIDKTISTTAIVILPTSQLPYFFIIICKNMDMTL